MKSDEYRPCHTTYLTHTVDVCRHDKALPAASFYLSRTIPIFLMRLLLRDRYGNHARLANYLKSARTMIALPDQLIGFCGSKIAIAVEQYPKVLRQRAHVL